MTGSLISAQPASQSARSCRPCARGHARSPLRRGTQHGERLPEREPLASRTCPPRRLLHCRPNG